MLIFGFFFKMLPVRPNDYFSL
uniref:Uncharacterized protein n=1 Tax=Lepeophtheirus salmonis TaxID=72036 RepID=A0A0K2TIT0_LEPSM